jgi:tyrosine-protein phosphatase SIW14
MASPSPTLHTGVSDPHQWRLWLAGLFGSRYDGLTHFHVVVPGVLMRCGQPRTSDLERIRAEHGLKTIICARGGTRHPLRGRWFRRELRYCRQHGLRFEHMPFSDHAPPPEHVFDRFLHIATDAANHPLLVHCEQGFHRTGILCAAYRLGCRGWTFEQAVEEMERFGFEAHRQKRRALLDALQNWTERGKKATRQRGNKATRQQG